MSPGRTLIFAHLFLRHRPGISPSVTVPRVFSSSSSSSFFFFHKHEARREGKRKRREVDGTRAGWTFPSGEFSCLRNKKLMRNATARCIWFRLHRQTEEMTAGAPIGHFEIEYAASLRLPAWSRPFSIRRPAFSGTLVICHREATAISSRAIGKLFTVEYIPDYVRNYGIAIKETRACSPVVDDRKTCS